MELLDARVRAVAFRLEAEGCLEAAPSGIPETPVAALSRPAPPPLPPESVVTTPLPAFSEPIKSVVRMPAPEKPGTPPPSAPEPDRDALELRLGSVWLVRIGIVILLTGLVFLGNFAYQNFVGRLGPGGRLALLYLAGIGLCATGAWLERGRPSVRNFARVLMGGGTATLYYATYGATFVEGLRVLHDPVFGGTLLLALTGAIAWLADSKRSETLAGGAVLLSFYTSAINPVAEFTLFSNLLLVALSVFFLVRRRWTTLSFLSLAAAYAAFGFWHFFHRGAQPWDFVARARFQPGIAILTCYWVLFTAGHFLVRDFPSGRRLNFLSLNNGAYFALATVLIREAFPAAYWTFPCGLGVACLGLAWLAWRRLDREPLADGAYLAQGLMFLTLGIVTKLSGHQLALALALEGAILTTCRRSRHPWIYQGAAMLVSGIAFVGGMLRITDESSLALPLGGTLALLFLYCARWNKRLDRPAAGGPAFCDFQPFSAYFTGMALVFGWVIIDSRLPFVWRYPVLSLATLFFAYSVSLHGLLELAILGQVYLGWAVVSWLGPNPPLPWWNPALLVAASMTLAHWWRRQPESRQRLGIAGQTVAALVTVILLDFWMDRALPDPKLMVVLPVLAMALLAYGAFTRTLALQIAGQLLVVSAAVTYFALLAVEPQPSAWYASAAFAGVVLNGMAIRAVFENSIWPGGSPALEPGGFPLMEAYRFLAMALYILWGFAYVPDRWMFAFFAFSALGLLGAGVWSRRPWRVRRCAILLLLALVVFWVEGDSQISRPNALAILTLLAVYHVVKRPMLNWPGLPGRWRDFVAYVLIATLWLLTTRWVRVGGHDFYTTIAWSVLAALVLGSGFLLRDRTHRRAGMALLGLAVGRVIFVDVWGLDPGYRIATFLVLGLLLPGLGFLYNRYADRIRTLE